MLLCLSIFESLKIRESEEAKLRSGDVELSVSEGSSLKVSTSGSTEDSE